MAGTLYGVPIRDWDSITVGSWQFTNTKITVDGEPSIKLDVAPAPGTDGARETYLGYIPAKISIGILLFEDLERQKPAELFTTWVAMIAQIKPKAGKTAPSPISISHPLLRIYGLSTFLVQSTPLLKPTGNQMYEGRIQVVEYFAKPKPQGAQSAATLAALPSIFDGDNRAKPTDPQTDNTGP